MDKPLEDALFRQLQRDAELAQSSRRDRLASVQRDLTRSIDHLNEFIFKPRTRPAGAGDPEPGPGVAEAQQQVGVLSLWLTKIQHQIDALPSGELRQRIKAAKQRDAIHGTLTGLEEARDWAEKLLLPSLHAEFDKIENADPKQRLTGWVDWQSEKALIEREIAEVRRLVTEINQPGQ